MDREIILSVTQKLIGPITPYADSAIDANRMKNTETFLYVLDQMQDMAKTIAREYKNSPYGSAKAIGVKIQKYLDNEGMEWVENNRHIVSIEISNDGK